MKRVKVLFDLVNYFRSCHGCTIEPQYLVILAQEKRGFALVAKGLNAYY